MAVEDPAVVEAAAVVEDVAVVEPAVVEEPAVVDEPAVVEDAAVLTADGVESGCRCFRGLCRFVSADPVDPVVSEPVSAELSVSEPAAPVEPEPVVRGGFRWSLWPVCVDTCWESVVDPLAAELPDVVDVVVDVSDELELVDVAGDADANPAGVPIAIPTPRAKANAPTRPTYLL